MRWYCGAILEQHSFMKLDLERTFSAAQSNATIPLETRSISTFVSIRFLTPARRSILPPSNYSQAAKCGSQPATCSEHGLTAGLPSQPVVNQIIPSVISIFTPLDWM